MRGKVTGLSANHSSEEKGYNELQLRVGRKLKEERLKAGVSQKEMAQRIGVSFQQIQKYETGTNSIPLYRLLRVAEFCGVNPSSFWGGVDIAPDLSEKTSSDNRSVLELVRAFRRIENIQARQRILDLMKEMAGDR